MNDSCLLVIAGHDPSGGAGIQADIEAAAACDVHAATVITLLTVQDTTDVHAVHGVDDDLFGACLDTVVADLDIAAIKTGAIASVAQVQRIAALARARPELPLVVDPVLAAAGGGRLASDGVGAAIRDELLDRATVVTPNAVEARLLCDGEADLDRCGARLSTGGAAVLITGGDSDDPEVLNRRYRAAGAPEVYRWPRLDGVFHGSGCTLASAIAARLARGATAEQAIEAAQRYTWQALADARRPGRGQQVPRRIDGDGSAA